MASQWSESPLRPSCQKFSHLHQLRDGRWYPQPLGRCVYQSTDLIETAIKLIPGQHSQLTHVQQQALTEYNILVANMSSIFDNGRRPDASVLLQYFQIFAAFFFPRTSMKLKVTIRWVDDLYADGETTWKLREGIRWCEILMSPHDEIPADQRCQEILNTLLHEACHWFPDEFCCLCDECSESSRSQVPQHSHNHASVPFKHSRPERLAVKIGRTGHCKLWQDLSLAVEEAAKRYLQPVKSARSYSSSDEASILLRHNSAREIVAWSMDRLKHFKFEIESGGIAPAQKNFDRWFPWTANRDKYLRTEFPHREDILALLRPRQ